MHMSLALALATAAIALPGSQAQTTQRAWTMTAIRSGDERVHQRPIHANGYFFWLGKPTASFCPPGGQQGQGCPPGNDTAVLVDADTDGAASYRALDMFEELRAGQQQGFVSHNGSLSYDPAHTDTVPADAQGSGFYRNTTGLTPCEGEYCNGGYIVGPNGASWAACVTEGCEEEGVYQIFDTLAPGFAQKGCIGIGILAGPYPSDEPPVYQYD